MNREVADPAADLRDLEALIDEVAAASVDIATLLHKTVVALGELLDERRSRAVDIATERSAATRRDVLGPDVLEIATLDAQAAGVSVAEYVRTAVLEYAARSSSPLGGGDGHDARAAQLLEARPETSRQTAERKRGPRAEGTEP